MYNLISSITSDVSSQINAQTFSVCESTTSTQTPNLPCYLSGTTPITYSLSSYNGAIVPSFVSINSVTGVLNITAVSISSSTDYSFSILSSVSGVTGSFQTVITLNVKKHTDESCSPSESEVAKSLSYTTQAVIAATILLSVGISFTNLSLLATLWSVLNQMQILHKWFGKYLFII